ncbi:YHL008C [Saccharomyces arboricola H-6]|uniref:YHL008C n=1 Tax=Saccharomyces arboricola (strain H-6 / AS 2.3317 / CBS 10644) TaxID=1160507 RepID=J8LN08_SACAR|nr:YHL008C [Saccharomyces arboricola H-6]
MVDDSSYLTPHETALAVVATAMKKARLQLDTLLINSILGGILFSSGSFLLVAVHSDDPGIVAQNPGTVNLITGVTFAIGLFYVVVMGADLFNSNILFFSVGVMRRAVSIYDLIVSWLVSWLGNIAGSLFVSYLFGHLTGIGSQELWVKGSKQIIEQKASFSFIQTFLKGIAGNFFVCLAIYLQLMAKPLHVKFIIMSFPIITFVGIGFTHVVADMSASFIAMLNGADVSVGEYIWKLLIPASLGNIVGGVFFSAVVPFYLHLVVVERDRKRLSLPEYEARDEQPELNMDSRVVRVPKQDRDVDGDSVNDDDMTETGGNFEDLQEKDSAGLYDIAHDSSSYMTGRSLNSLLSTPSSVITSENATMQSDLGEPVPFVPQNYSTTRSSHTPLSNKAINRRYSNKRYSIRSPPGVFPVRGMGEPLEREKTIEDATYDPREDELFLKRAETHYSTIVKNNNKGDDDMLRLVKTEEDREKKEYENNGGYNILENKPGAKLERIITHIAEGIPSKESIPQGLPRTTQDTFPHNTPVSSPTYTDDAHSLHRANSTTLGGLFRAVSKEFHPSKDAESPDDLLKKMAAVGINRKARITANNVAGIVNLDMEDLGGPPRRKIFTGPKHPHQCHTTSQL